MTLEHDDSQDAVNEALNIIEKNKMYEVKIPLGVAYWIGMTVVTTMPLKDGPALQQSAPNILSKLEVIVPLELIDAGSEDYPGDLSITVPITLSQSEIEYISKAVLALPTGKHIIASLPIDPSDRAELEGFRNKQLKAFLALYEEFILSGGVINPQIKEAVEEELS